MTGVQTVGSRFADAISTDPTRPMLTFYDDSTDERTELSGATLANWVAKTANLLVDDVAVALGDRAAIGLPPHWQTAAVLLGCWTAGLAIGVGPEPAEVAFVYADDATHDWPAAERYALGLHPLALPLRTVPDGYLDYAAEVRSHGDHFHPVEAPVPGSDAWITPAGPESHAHLIERAAERAGTFGIRGGRVLIDADTHPDPVDWLLAPIVAGATIVLCRNLDAARADGRASSERVTHRV